MKEIDNCPVCNTTCELEYGLEETVGTEYETEIMYATCKTCETRWRRRDDPKELGKLIYEKWACLIPQTTIPIPFMGGGIKLRPRWCRWVKVKEKSIPVGHLRGYEITPSEEEFRPKEVVADETISINKREFHEYGVKLKRSETLKGEIHADAPINVYFMNEQNFEKFVRDKTFDYEDGSENFWEGSIEYFVPKKDEWFLVLENEGKESVRVKVYLYL